MTLRAASARRSIGGTGELIDPLRVGIPVSAKFLGSASMRDARVPAPASLYSSADVKGPKQHNNVAIFHETGSGDVVWEIGSMRPTMPMTGVG